MGVIGLEKAMTPTNIRKGFSNKCIWLLSPLAMDDKMGPSEVFVNIAVEVHDINDINENEVANEHVEEVLGERITKSQEGGTQCTVELRDDNGDIMHVVEMG